MQGLWFLFSHWFLLISLPKLLLVLLLDLFVDLGLSLSGGFSSRCLRRGGLALAGQKLFLIFLEIVKLGLLELALLLCLVEVVLIGGYWPVIEHF